MIFSETAATKIADFLLEIKAVVLQPSAPFTWASGWKSPIYCDNRKTLSFPKIRTSISDYFVAAIEQKFGRPDVIAGVATGGIALGVLVAERMDLPFVYIRSKAKGHGLENAIEGVIHSGQKVVVIEDLISTGGSSLAAVAALRAAGCEVVGMAAIFTYAFELAENNFTEANCPLVTLSDYHSLIETALKSGYVAESDLDRLREWRQSPQTWGQLANTSSASNQS